MNLKICCHDYKKEKKKKKKEDCKETKQRSEFIEWQVFLLRALIVKSKGGDKGSNTSPAHPASILTHTHTHTHSKDINIVYNVICATQYHQISNQTILLSSIQQETHRKSYQNKSFANSLIDPAGCEVWKCCLQWIHTYINQSMR